MSYDKLLFHERYGPEVRNSWSYSSTSACVIMASRVIWYRETVRLSLTFAHICVRMCVKMAVCRTVLVWKGWCSLLDLVTGPSDGVYFFVVFISQNKFLGGVTFGHDCDLP